VNSNLASSQTLRKLRDLQVLREHRSKADHARALRAVREANGEVETVAAKLDTHNQALDHYAEQGELQIDQFQIFAQLITQSEAELQSRRETHGQAAEEETRTAQIRVRAEKQTEQLSERLREARSKERRKDEDKSSREFLSQWTASKPEKSKGARL